jgi:hypothetical protein
VDLTRPGGQPCGLTHRRLDKLRLPTTPQAPTAKRDIIPERNERKGPTGLQGRRHKPYPDRGKVGNGVDLGLPSLLCVYAQGPWCSTCSCVFLLGRDGSAIRMSPSAYRDCASSCDPLLPSLTPKMPAIYPTNASSVSGFLATTGVHSSCMIHVACKTHSTIGLLQQCFSVHHQGISRLGAHMPSILTRGKNHGWDVICRHTK